MDLSTLYNDPEQSDVVLCLVCDRPSGTMTSITTSDVKQSKRRKIASHDEAAAADTSDQAPSDQDDGPGSSSRTLHLHKLILHQVRMLKGGKSGDRNCAHGQNCKKHAYLYFCSQNTFRPPSSDGSLARAKGGRGMPLAAYC